jgi:tRNA wybutosine-synthesizing protein 3
LIENVVFTNKKKIALHKLETALSENKVDLEVLELINLINALDNYYTTSSCAGRIVILSKNSFRGKYSASFLFKKHDLVSFNEIDSVLRDLPDFVLLYLNVEPPTFHIAASSINHAIFLHQMALDSGLGYSMFKTIKKSIVIEVRGTGMLQIPIGHNNKVFIEPPYLKFVLDHGNEILKQEQNRVKLFKERIEQSL